MVVSDDTRDDDFAAAAAVLEHLGDPDHPAALPFGTRNDAPGHYVTLNHLRALHAAHPGNRECRSNSVE